MISLRARPLPYPKPSALGTAALVMRHALTDARRMALTTDDKQRLNQLEAGARLLVAAAMKTIRTVRRGQLAPR